ncbi:hypothetical protein PFISCL1PPCAC_13262, partial [Pristionchus fissidentatus]
MFQFKARAFYSTINEPQQQLFEELYPGTPTFRELVTHSALVFVNSEPLIDFAQPTLSKVIHIGGITVTPPNPLNEYWSSVMSARPRTVLVSFGSVAKSVMMKHARKAALLESFSSFPDTTFIWKYENTSDSFAMLEAAKVPNVVLTEWMPQLDLLADPRLTLFVSHGGMASCQEIAAFGVPALLVPIFADQNHNAGALAHAGLALVFSKFDMIDTGKVRTALDKMLSDPRFRWLKMHYYSYKQRALRIRDQLAARPSSPAEKFVKNIEFVARFGHSHTLRPLSLNLSTFQFYGCDLAVIVVATVTAVVLSL